MQTTRSHFVISTKTFFDGLEDVSPRLRSNALWSKRRAIARHSHRESVLARGFERKAASEFGPFAVCTHHQLCGHPSSRRTRRLCRRRRATAARRRRLAFNRVAALSWEDFERGGQWP